MKMKSIIGSFYSSCGECCHSDQTYSGLLHYCDVKKDYVFARNENICSRFASWYEKDLFGEYCNRYRK